MTDLIYKMCINISFKSFLTIVLFSGALFFYAFAKAQSTTPKKFKVVLDAGHGGHDSGNRGNGYYEKNIALDIVLALGAELEKQNDVEVIYTRKKDVFLELWERADIANRANADLFISVHCNSHSSQAKGTETFVLGIDGNEKNMTIAKKENSVILLEENYEQRYAGFDPNKPETTIGLELMQEEYLDQSISLASFVEKEFTSNVKRSSRGVKQALFWVLHRSVMPSVLIETGFLTNDEEGRFLNSKAGRTKMAQAISAAVTNYKKNIQASENILVAEKVVAPSKTDIAVTPKIYKDITFKVQIAAGKRKLDTKPYNFNGLPAISRLRENKLYKYYTGETSDHTEALDLLKTAKSKGYASAFIVSFTKEGVKVPLEQVLN